MGGFLFSALALHYLCTDTGMLTKNQIKFIQSLGRKKGRSESGCFLAEGNKLVEDMLGFFVCRILVATREWLAGHGDVGALQTVEVSREELARVSQLTTPQDVLAVYEMPVCRMDEDDLVGELSLVLDAVQDPGNVGTIVRIADWMGIRRVICSPETADVYGPKVVQATMGALARVSVHYVSLVPFLERMRGRLEVYGTFLDGTNMYDVPLACNGLIIMGNEGRGISPALEPYVTSRLYIPNYPPGSDVCESLNVAVATAITCAEFRRRVLSGKVR